jgi:hypothetical protein
MRTLIKNIATVILTALIFLPVDALSVSCDMKHSYSHQGKTVTKIYSSELKTPSLYYRANMDVNTDGTAKSYHPMDPEGKTKAFNNIGNMITVAWNASGKKITCDGGNAANRKGPCFTEFLNAFIGARNNQYNPNKFPKIETEGIIPWRLDSELGWKMPCTNEEDSFKGFFISQTSVNINPQLGICDQNRYVDSLTINAVVYPKKTIWKSQGIVTDGSDLVVTRNRANGQIEFAIHGDKGPKNKIGEGSIALTSALLKKNVSSDATYSQISNFVVPSVDYIVFPANDVVKHYKGSKIDQSKINEYGAKVFKEWGGLERLDTCSNLSN